VPPDGPSRPDYGAVFESVPASYLLLDADLKLTGIAESRVNRVAV
jgi:hypothetical protein